MEDNYKKVVSKDGKDMWYKNGRRVAERDVPKAVISPEDDENAPETQEVPEKVSEEPKKYNPPHNCIFCGGPSEHQRLINFKQVMYKVNLCGNCYYTRTLGEITGAVRKGVER